MKKLVLAACAVVALGLAFGVYRQMTSVKNVVVIYTPHHGDFMESISKAFEAKYPDIKVQVIRGGTTQIEDRIRSEKAKPLGDVMYGGDVGTYIQLKKNDLIQPNVLSVAGKLPADMQDPDGYWFAPYRLPGVFFYNNQLVTKAQAPQDWSDFLKSEWKDALLILNPTQSGTARTFYIALIKVWGHDKAFDYFKKLNDQLNGQYVGSHDKLFAAISRGEGKIAMANEADLLKAKYKKNLPFDIVYPLSGTYMNPEPIAIIAGAPHKDAAQKFVEFVFEIPVLAIAAVDYMKRPTLTDFPKDKLPEVLRVEPKTFNIDWTSVGDQGSVWLQQWSTDIWHKS